MTDDLPPDAIRSPRDVALRSLALFSVIGLALGADRREVTTWLSDNNLWNALTPIELKFIQTPEPTRKQMIVAGWWSERLVVLLWALRAVHSLPPANEQCDTALFQTILPPFADTSVEQFVAPARLRSREALIEQADAMQRSHWEARDARRRGRAPSTPVEIEIIQERHHAINWITGYDGLEWDEVTTDT